MNRKQTYIQASVLLIALATTAKPLAESVKLLPAIAQDAAPLFKLPSSLPDGTEVTVDGSSSMSIPNQALKQRFEQKYAGTAVTLTNSTTPAALAALKDGKLDLAAIGRPLTKAEKAAGLQEVLLRRGKIAIITGTDNPYKGSLTFEQFAKMFRGEITNWKQVGGEPGAIKFVDRPATSDTRQALSTYKVFQAAPFKAGANTTQVAEDDTAAVVKELGKAGISYAIADQVLTDSSARIVPLHKTLPTDPRYPFSQPRGYAFPKDPKAGAQAFLGFATSEPGKEAVTAAIGEASPSPAVTTEPTPSPTTETAQAPAPAMTEEKGGGFPWWLLAIPLLGALAWWFFKGGGTAPAAAPVAAPIPPVVPPAANSRIILTPRNCRQAYAYWEVPQAEKDALKRQGGQNLVARVCDVTGIDLDRAAAHHIEQFDCSETDPDLQVPIPTDDRDYLVELGYITEDGRWLKLARSEHVRVPACKPGEAEAIAAGTPITDATPGNGLNLGTVAPAVGVGAVAAGLAGAAALPGILGDDRFSTVPDSSITLTPRSYREVDAHWEVHEATQRATRAEGGTKPQVRLYDVTSIDLDRVPPHSVKEFSWDEKDSDRILPIQTPDRDYLAEIGYETDDNTWLKLARSKHIRVPAAPSGEAIAGLAGVGAAAVAGVAGVAGAVGAAVSAAIPGTDHAQEIKVNSRANCYLLTPEEMNAIQQKAVSTHLEPGTYVIGIKDGAFDYQQSAGHVGEPWVLLWLHGGKVINKKTNTLVQATWSTLNGYDDTMTVEVQEPATLSAFFIDTYVEDNEGEVTVAVNRL